MQTFKNLTTLTASLLVGLMITGTASAAPVLCKVVTNYHMLIDDSVVANCLDAGEGNLTGNPMNDLFINGVGTDYDFIGAGAFSQDQNNATAAGTFTFDDSLWAIYSDIAIAFKFGTGNNADEWFVYSLQSLLASGDYDWDFIKVSQQGGGLSHVNFYGILDDDRQLPEPGTLALLGLAFIVMGSCAWRQGRGAV